MGKFQDITKDIQFLLRLPAVQENQKLHKAIVKLQEDFLGAEAEAQALREELLHLRPRHAQLRAKPTALEEDDKAAFRYANDVIWKRKQPEGYEETPYCPHCFDGQSIHIQLDKHDWDQDRSCYRCPVCNFFSQGLPSPPPVEG